MNINIDLNMKSVFVEKEKLTDCIRLEKVGTVKKVNEKEFLIKLY